MNKQKKVEFIKKVLDDLYPNPPIPLQHQDAYTLLIAVVLSAQCTDARVNQVTPILFSKADNPSAMIRLSPKEIEEIIRSCGLAPRKSLAIWKLSHLILENHGGMVPNTFEELEALPGVGHKTASVVMAQAFEVPAFPVDTHIHRLAKRWGLSEGKSVLQTESDLKQLFKKKDWIKLHLQMIYFAREHCPAIKHQATQCPICSAILSGFDF